MDGWISFLTAAIVAGTPILFATVGEIITEKSGHLNLGVEGLMMLGAVMGFTVAMHSGNPIAAMVAAMIAGAGGSFLYAFLTVSLRANQVVTGLTLTIFGTGLSKFLGKDLVGQVIPEGIKQFFLPYSIPGLSQIPFFGPILFKHDVFVYFGYFIAIIAGIYLYNTTAGRNVRAIGENPAAADAAGINVTLYKYFNILAGGALCGLGGAYLSLVYVPAWQENVTAGRGWIAVALVIFAAWNPYKVLFGAYFFGGLDIVGFRIQGSSIHISQYLIDMLPYVATIAVLTLVSMKKSKENAPPKNLGVPYFREER